MELLVELTGKKKLTMTRNFTYHKRKPSNYDDVIRYLDKRYASQKKQDSDI